MRYLDISYPSPQENLACDEFLLDAAEAGRGPEILRFWDPSCLFAVLGYSNEAGRELHLETCRSDGVPVLRRSSGGGTVLQGPGCLNYSLILNSEKRPGMKNITLSNRTVLEKHRQALSPLVEEEIRIQGLSDLTLGSRKISGNAQRRRKTFLLFHGTLLLDFNIPLIARYLAMPSREPDYRQHRDHENFLTNLPLNRDTVTKALKKIWMAAEAFPPPRPEELRDLIRDRYSSDAWNFKR